MIQNPFARTALASSILITFGFLAHCGSAEHDLGQGREYLRGDGAACPAVASPEASFCDGGPIVPVTDPDGCVRRFACDQVNTPTCPAIAQPPASYCDGGTVVPVKDADGCTRRFDCAARQADTCPAIAAPQASFCDGGTILNTYRQDGCHIGFTCVDCTNQACGVDCSRAGGTPSVCNGQGRCVWGSSAALCQ